MAAKHTVRSNRYPLLIAVVSAIVVLTVLSWLVVSRAASPVVSIHTATGTVNGVCANKVSDSSSASGTAVKFAGCGGGATRTLNCTPAPNATMTNNVSHLCGFPDVTNTGVPPGTVLKRVPEDITKGPGWEWDGKRISVSNGAVLDGLSFGADLSIDADNVTVKNCYMKAHVDNFGIAIRHADNVTIQDSTLESDPGANRSLTLITDVYRDSQNIKIQRVNFIGSSGAASMDAGLLEDSYIHDLGYAPGDHTNGFTTNNTNGPLIIRHNTILNSYSQTDAISLFQDFGPQRDRLIDNNLVAGGSYCIYGGSDGPSSGDIRITNNHFSRMYFANCGEYGPIAHFNSGDPGNIWSGNIWDDTGATVPNL